MKIGTLTENRTQEFCLEDRHFTIKLLARFGPAARDRTELVRVTSVGFTI